jgi:PAS domain S-box-containing protein
MSVASDRIARDRAFDRPSPGVQPILDLMPFPAWVYGETDQRILAINGRAAQHYGYSHEEFLALRSIDLEAAPAATSESSTICRHRKADGTIIAVRLETSRIDVDGSPAWLVAAVDVTEQERALEESERRNNALAASELQSRQVLEAAADYSWEQDSQYRMTYLSPTYEQIFGTSPAEALGKRLTDHPGTAIEPAMGEMVMRALAQRRPFRDFTYSRSFPDGRVRWFKTSGVPIFGADGEFTGYRGAGAEITSYVEADAWARMGQQRLQEAVAHVTQPIVVYDAEDRIAAYNQVFQELHRVPNDGAGPAGSTVSVAEIAERMGVSPALADSEEWQQRVGMLLDESGGFASVIHQGFFYRETAEWELSQGFYADGPGDAAPDLATLLARYRSEEEHTYRLRDGRWMMVVYRPLPGGGRLGLWTDITAIKRAEAERLALEAQLHHSQRLEALGTLAGGAAHEINNALVPTIALTKLVAKKLPEDSRERHNLNSALKGAERARDLVKQILAFSRHDGTVRPTDESVNIGTVLHDALSLMRAILPTSIRLDEEIAPVPAIAGDPTQLRQVIVNLMTNAAQAIGPALGGIVVSLQQAGDHLHVSVADTGCGMDEATLERIFEPFFTTKPVGEGTGLGLSVAHGIVKAHGGRIEAKSTPGQGSRFDIFIPVPAAA